MQTKQRVIKALHSYGSYFVQSQYQMFSKFSQIKSFITHAITSLQSQKPIPPSDDALPQKLSFFLDHIMKATSNSQFKAYHELQSPQISLNQLLQQIYHSSIATTEQIVSIIHFYTFLLINCNNQLVLCKIVSDSFVIELTQIYPNCLHTYGQSIVDLEEINSYKIALVKSYVSRINVETAKYMVIAERLRIFQNCISFCLSFQGKQQWGVQITCMSNCVLLISKFLADHTQYYSFCFQQNGLNDLLLHLVTLIHESIRSINHADQYQEQQMESLRSAILFTIDLLQNVSEKKYRKQLIQITFQKLADFRQLFRQLVDHFSEKQTKQMDYMKLLELIKVLLKLIALYFKTNQLTGLFQRSLLPILDKFIYHFKIGIKRIFCLQQKPKLQISKMIHLFCSVMEIMSLILQQGGYLQRRNVASSEEKQLKALVVNRIIDIIELFLSEEATTITFYICSKSVKLLLLSLMQLTVENDHTLHEYSVLKLHQHCIKHMKEVMKKSQTWDFIVMHYQAILKQVSEGLLTIDSIQANQYLFCQTHDPCRLKQSTNTQFALNSIFLNQYARSFRFMIVETTHVSMNSIKLQKSYHMNFVSPGWAFEPGQQVENQQIKQVCRIVHITNDMKIPIVVANDQQALIFIHVEQQSFKKVILNIRYKKIQGFTVQKDLLRIKLKGAQEILVEGSKQQVKKFKEYLIEKRDRSRQKQLKFINQSLQIYFQDNIKVIGQIGEKDIEDLLSIEKQDLQNQNQAETKILAVQTISPQEELNQKIHGVQENLL